MREHFTLTMPSDRNSDRVWFDIETVKVEAPADWSNKKRWSVFMLAYATCSLGSYTLRCVSGTEEEIVRLAERLFSDNVAVYAAGYRDFDRHVLEGRFTNARAALSEKPGDWAHLHPGTNWENVAKTEDSLELSELGLVRSPDIESRFVPLYWGQRDFDEPIAIHCVKDVIEVCMQDPKCELTDGIYAVLSAIYQN